MKTNYTPGQILYIKSSMGPWYYISVLRRATPVEYADETYELHTCCDLCITPHDTDCLTFARGDGSFLDIDTVFTEVRMATSDEYTYLYKALVKAFKDHDLGWDKHFTDSTYDDIRDWLCWEFNIDLDALTDNIIVGDNNPLVDTIYEITNYIWDALCKETGNYLEETTEPEMVSLDKACKVFQEMLMKYNKYVGHNIPMLEWEDEFRKRLEE